MDETTYLPNEYCKCRLVHAFHEHAALSFSSGNGLYLTITVVGRWSVRRLWVCTFKCIRMRSNVDRNNLNISSIIKGIYALHHSEWIITQSTQISHCKYRWRFNFRTRMNEWWEKKWAYWKGEQRERTAGKWKTGWKARTRTRNRWELIFFFWRIKTDLGQN